MSITAPQQDVTFEQRISDAWGRYSEQLRGLTGAGYEQAERESWELLQVELADIAAEHESLTL